MTALRILHVDDEPDIRELVGLSLGLDQAFSVRSCDRGRDAVAAAIDWPPDLMLIDVMMPGMDGPATLASLRQAPQTADIPVVFMTARAQSHELERFKSLGASGVIAKPFDPMTLAATVRSHLHALGAAARRADFVGRLRADVKIVVERWSGSRADAASSVAALAELQVFAQTLSGAADVLGFDDLRRLAVTLAEVATAAASPAIAPGKVDQALAALVAAAEDI
jgi:CheY-like chemotaxis protein